MLFGSLSEINGGLSLDNFTVSSSEIIMHRANRLFPDISGRSIGRFSSIRFANYLTENAESWVWKLRCQICDVKIWQFPALNVARRKFEALDGEIHFESTKSYR